MGATALIGATVGLNVMGNLASAGEQQQQAANQAYAMRTQAAQQKSQGAAQESQIREQGDRYVSQGIAASAGSGVAYSGSVQDAIEESMYNIELDAVRTRENALQSAYATEAGAQAALNSAPSGLSTLLNVGSSVASGYAQNSMYKAGI